MSTVSITVCPSGLWFKKTSPASLPLLWSVSEILLSSLFVVSHKQGGHKQGGHKPRYAIVRIERKPKVKDNKQQAIQNIIKLSALLDTKI